jgi:hypothetical protein
MTGHIDDENDFSDYDEPDGVWSIGDFVRHLERGDPEADSLVVRAVTARMAVTLDTAGTSDPMSAALDLGHALRSIAGIAGHLLVKELNDLDDDEKDPNWATLVGRLNACAADFRQIGGSF